MENYNDIINLPHHKSSTRPHMSNRDRAAQFAPFAALTGHDSAIKETARLTDDFIEISEDKMTALSARMQMIIENILETPEVEFTYFAPDENKLGGAYISKMGNVRRVDEYDRVVIFTDGVKIPIDSIIDINGEFFSTLD